MKKPVHCKACIPCFSLPQIKAAIPQADINTARTSDGEGPAKITNIIIQAKPAKPEKTLLRPSRRIRVKDKPSKIPTCRPDIAITWPTPVI